MQTINANARTVAVIMVARETFEFVGPSVGLAPFLFVVGASVVIVVDVEVVVVVVDVVEGGGVIGASQSLQNIPGFDFSPF